MPPKGKSVSSAPRRAWSKEEEKVLSEMKQGGKMVRDMIQVFPHRSETQIRAKLSRMSDPIKTEGREMKKQKANDILSSILRVPSKQDELSNENSKKEEKEEEGNSILLLHWIITMEDTKLYLLLIKPTGSKVQVHLQEKGDSVSVFLTYEDVSRCKTLAAEKLGIKEEFLNIHIEPFCQKGIIVLPSTVTNSPNILTKTETSILICWPILEYDATQNPLEF